MSEKMPRGLFISLEGGDGTGKSTQAERLAQALEARGHSVTLTREPGGTIGAEAIRSLLVTGEGDRWDALTEALLLNAARRDHVEKLIGPALVAGRTVISDRYADSTLVYQGHAQGLDMDLLLQLHALATGGLWPDVTFVLQIDKMQALDRARRTGESEQRFEAKGAAFHALLAEGFARLPGLFPERCVSIDASGAADAVTERLLAALGAGQLHADRPDE